jgi:outer membrane lipoprotein-sorting protein
MKKRIILFFTFLSFSFALLFGLSATDVLKKVEERMIGGKAPKDIEAVMVMEIHKGSSVKIRKLKVWTKNNINSDDWKIMKFISPADVKNVGFLTLSEDDMYLYLPEFHRIRRIASSNKKDSFMGSDFSYDDLGTTNFSKNYKPELVKENDKIWVLKLIRKNGVKKPYKKIILTIDRTTYMPISMDMYDDSGVFWKKAEERTKKIGSYNIITFIKMEDKRKGSYTTLELKDIKTDQNLSKKIFSKRFLKRRVK